MTKNALVVSPIPSASSTIENTAKAGARRRFRKATRKFIRAEYHALPIGMNGLRHRKNTARKEKRHWAKIGAIFSGVDLFRRGDQKGDFLADHCLAVPVHDDPVSLG